jgi:Rps23 Pro-64 3,4-dihydroxylase Tpa1-like proline 4-hydroxylase
MAGEGEIIRPSLLADPSSRQELAASYKAAGPYPHCVIPEICNPDMLRRVREEIINNIEATYKETDLFKMLQTGDLANMDKLDSESAAKLPTVRALRDAIYSTEFRQFITDITGCGDLSDVTDCACNIHPMGGHLLCHDDVIGDRLISYIVYLTDPEDPWTAEDGGALELYPEKKDTPNTPDVVPTATALPVWNTMAMFQVLPGRSFHSIQEIYTSEKPRMSIQGWFHSSKPPTDAALATLKQLQACPGEDDVLDRFEPLKWTTSNIKTAETSTAAAASDGNDPAGLATDAPLCSTDIALLREWINPVYLDASDAAIGKIHKCIQDDGSVQLHNFLCEEKAKEIGVAIVAADSEDALGNGKVPKYTAGFGNGWNAVGPCHKQRYMQYAPTVETAPSSTNPSATAGELLYKIKTELFASPSFARLLHRVTDFTLTHYRAEARRFRPGLDYTVAHYGCLTQDPRLDAVLCFVADGAEGASEAWESGEMGGYEAYLLADEDEEKPAEVYRGPTDDESGVLNVSPAFNCLSLVLRDEGLMRFVKYLSAQAPGSRWDVSGVYVPEDDSDEEEEEEAK